MYDYILPHRYDADKCTALFFTYTHENHWLTVEVHFQLASDPTKWISAFKSTLTE